MRVLLIILLVFSFHSVVQAEELQILNVDVYENGTNPELLATEAGRLKLAKALDLAKRFFPHTDDLPSSTDLGDKPYELARLVSMDKLSYPTILKRRNLEGSVEVMALVSEEGRVLDAVIAKSTNAHFNLPAIDSVKHWLFKPAQLDGKPCKSVVVAPITYRLREQELIK